jgi:hypothetical protein
MTQIGDLELFCWDLETTQGQFRVISKTTVGEGGVVKIQPYFVLTDKPRAAPDRETHPRGPLDLRCTGALSAL